MLSEILFELDTLISSELFERPGFQKIFESSLNEEEKKKELILLLFHSFYKNNTLLQKELSQFLSTDKISLRLLVQSGSMENMEVYWIRMYNEFIRRIEKIDQEIKQSYEHSHNLMVVDHTNKEFNEQNMLTNGEISDKCSNDKNNGCVIEEVKKSETDSYHFDPGTEDVGQAHSYSDEKNGDLVMVKNFLTCETGNKVVVNENKCDNPIQKKNLKNGKNKAQLERDRIFLLNGLIFILRKGIHKCEDNKQLILFLNETEKKYHEREKILFVESDLLRIFTEQSQIYGIEIEREEIMNVKGDVSSLERRFKISEERHSTKS